MTDKDHELIATALNIAKPNWNIAPPAADMTYKICRENAWDNICRTLAERLALDDPKFDRDKFLTACGIGTTV
jgi:hypothetical protein